MIANAKIKRVVMSIEYPDESFKNLFKEAGIEYVSINVPDLKIIQKK